MKLPAIGEIVHYRSYGTPGGEYGAECRAAIVTEHTGDPVDHHGGDGEHGDPHCPDRPYHGNPFRYCACGWTEPAYKGGTWHRPEQT
jgi:hypothetical protein